jgi:hypothetical protein
MRSAPRYRTMPVRRTGVSTPRGPTVTFRAYRLLPLGIGAPPPRSQALSPHRLALHAVACQTEPLTAPARRQVDPED